MSVRETLWQWATPPYPTLIPKYAVNWGRRFLSGTLVDVLWKLFLVVVGGALLVLALSSGVAFVAAIAGIVLSIFLADDIQQLASDIWHRDFYRFP